MTQRLPDYLSVVQPPNRPLSDTEFEDLAPEASPMASYAGAEGWTQGLLKPRGCDWYALDYTPAEGWSMIHGGSKFEARDILAYRRNDHDLYSEDGGRDA